MNNTATALERLQAIRVLRELLGAEIVEIVINEESQRIVMRDNAPWIFQAQEQTTGPCVTCQQPTTRYGDSGKPHCPTCR